MRVQAFVAKLAVEALHVAVLHRLAGFNVVELHLFSFAPFAYGITNKFGAVIYANASGQPAFFGELLQSTQHARSRQA